MRWKMLERQSWIDWRSSRPAEFKTLPLDWRQTPYRSNPLLADLDGAPAVTDTLDPHLALAPIATGRDFGIAGTISLGRRRTIGVRRRRIVTGRRRGRRVISRRRAIGDGAADEGGRGHAPHCFRG